MLGRGDFSNHYPRKPWYCHTLLFSPLHYDDISGFIHECLNDPSMR
ncbi:hypothetical protein [Holospora curviuscula]|nr:hypothetical protein [Holospora curviuscula]